MIYMKCQALFSIKMKKKVLHNLLSAAFVIGDLRIKLACVSHLMLTLIPLPFLLSQFFFLLFTSAAYNQIHFRLDFFMKANTMNADQTAPLGAV